MSTAFIYNGHDKYDEKNGELGGYLKYGGVNFWLPFQKVTPIPDFQFREVDHNASTPNPGEYGELTYKTVRIKGNFIADQLCNQGIPMPLKDMGISVIEGKLTGKTISVEAGFDDPERKGDPAIILYADVQEREATRTEASSADRLSKIYKEQVIQEYLQSKRQRMNGGQGRQYPDKRTRLYMEELGVQDVDDVLAHQKQAGGIDAGTIAAIVEIVRGATEVNTETLRDAIATIRKSGNEARVAKAKPKSAGLAEFKAKYDAEHAEVKS